MPARCPRQQVSRGPHDHHRIGPRQGEVLGVWARLEPRFIGGNGSIGGSGQTQGRNKFEGCTGGDDLHPRPTLAQAPQHRRSLDRCHAAPHDDQYGGRIQHRKIGIHSRSLEDAGNVGLAFHRFAIHQFQASMPRVRLDGSEGLLAGGGTLDYGHDESGFFRHGF